jgi:hypothetical protein
MSRYKKYLIVIFPFLYLFLGLYFRQIFGDLSLRSTDPEYIHFLSGMCISTGQFSQANIDHPGSGLQVLLAIVFRLVYLFRGKTYPFFEDAMINSDMYLAVGNLIITLLLSATLLWAGYKTLKITKNIVYALVIQSSPLLINIWCEIFGRIYPELLFVIPVLILQVQLLKEIYRENEGSSIGDILTYSFGIALGMSLKMTFLPFIFLPLIILNPIKRKMQFVVASSLIFLLIALPVTLQLERFWNWMKGIFIHSGGYQSGEKNIINKDLFVENFKNIISSEKTFFIIFAVLIVSFIALTVFRPKIKTERKKLILINSGLLVVVLLITFIVSKQFAERYFIPALLFFPFLMILIQENVMHYFYKKSIRIALSTVMCFITLFFIYRQLPYIQIVSEGIGIQMQARNQTRSFINTLPEDAYTVIVTQDYGCPYHEYAIMYSFCVAGGGWPGYKEKLNRIYPNRYFYFTWDNTIKLWGDEFNPKEISESGKPLYLYLEQNKEELYTRTIQKLLENHPEFVAKKELLFENKKNGEGIMRLDLSLKKDTIAVVSN